MIFGYSIEVLLFVIVGFFIVLGVNIILMEILTR